MGKLVIARKVYPFKVNATKKSSKTVPFVSVIIPSRNEAYRIGKCIKSLKLQTYPRLEILIVDDSTDDTVQVIKSIVRNDGRFKVIKEDKLPDGWIGKPHALQQGSTQAKGEWLLFIDADTYHDPELIERAVEYAIKKKLDMLSLVPHHICESFWEKVIQPIPLGIFFPYEVPSLTPGNVHGFHCR